MRPLQLSFLLLAVFSGAARVEAQGSFIRGDTNFDGVVDVGDCVNLLTHLFEAIPEIMNCLSVADFNDDEAIDIADPIFGLSYLFVGGSSIPLPFPDCGMDPTPGGLACASILPQCPTDPPLSPEVDPSPPFTSLETFIFTGTGQAGGQIRVSGSNLAEMSEAPIDDLGNWSVEVTLPSNSVSSLFFTVLDVFGQVSSPTPRMILQDSLPPTGSFAGPTDGQVIYQESIALYGTLADEHSGVDPQLTVLVVNGLVAPDPVTTTLGLGSTANFLVPEFFLPLGPTVLQMQVEDAVGNSFLTAPITVVRGDPPPLAPILTPYSGDAQFGQVGTWLFDPIQVLVTHPDGTPFEGKPVTFTIERNDGKLNSGPFDGSALYQTLTDGSGVATAYWCLGNFAGAASNRVVARTMGSPQEVIFCASSNVAAGAESSISAGMTDYQIIEAGAPAVSPLRTYVSDGVNPIANATVLYTVVEGTGVLSATSSRSGVPSLAVMTDSTGHAELGFVAGPEVGEQLVEARLASALTEVVSFTFETRDRSEVGLTTFSAEVTDPSGAPLEGVECQLDFGAVSFTQMTDDLGKVYFSTGAASGACTLKVLGPTVQSVGGNPVPSGVTYPTISYAEVVLPEADSRHIGVIKLPPLVGTNGVYFDGSAEVELTLPGVDGFKITVPAETRVEVPVDGGDPVIVETGSGNGVTLTLAPIEVNKLPMPMPDGLAPPFAATLQPSGTTFDPPLPIEVPNFKGLAPGTITHFLVWDQTDARFEINASGTVTTDGSVTRSDPGSGISLAGWHCEFAPPRSVSARCKKCNDRCNAPCRTDATTIPTPGAGLALNAILSSLGAGVSLSSGGVVSLGAPNLTFASYVETCQYCCNGNICTTKVETGFSATGTSQLCISTPAGGWEPPVTLNQTVCFGSEMYKIELDAGLPSLQACLSGSLSARIADNNFGSVCNGQNCKLGRADVSAGLSVEGSFGGITISVTKYQSNATCTVTDSSIPVGSPCTIQLQPTGTLKLAPDLHCYTQVGCTGSWWPVADCPSAPNSLVWSIDAIGFECFDRILQWPAEEWTILSW